MPVSGEAGVRLLRAAKLADTKVTRCRAAPGGLSRSEKTASKALKAMDTIARNHPLVHVHPSRKTRSVMEN